MSGDLDLPHRRNRDFSLLLAAQVALSVTLLIGAALMARGVVNLQRRDLGFAVDGVSVIRFELPARSMDSAHNQVFFRSIMETGASALLALTINEPFGNSFSQTDFRPVETAQDQRSFVDYQEVTGEYFDVLRIPIVALTGGGAEARIGACAEAPYVYGCTFMTTNVRSSYCSASVIQFLNSARIWDDISFTGR